MLEPDEGVPLPQALPLLVLQDYAGWWDAGLTLVVDHDLCWFPQTRKRDVLHKPAFKWPIYNLLATFLLPSYLDFFPYFW